MVCYLVVVVVKSATSTVLNEAIRLAGQQWFEFLYGYVHIYHGVPKFIRFLALRISPFYAVSLGSVASDVEEPAEDINDVSDEQRLSWLSGMGRSPLWLHKRVTAKMMGFDSSTNEGMD